MGVPFESRCPSFFRKSSQIQMNVLDYIKGISLVSLRRDFKSEIDFSVSALAHAQSHYLGYRIRQRAFTFLLSRSAAGVVDRVLVFLHPPVGYLVSVRSYLIGRFPVDVKGAVINNTYFIV